MATQEEREICKAPLGKLQIVHIDPRDHWPTRQGEPQTREEVARLLSLMMGAHRDTMQVFDDSGELVLI
jgi:hypothetical protein